MESEPRISNRHVLQLTIHRLSEMEYGYHKSVPLRHGIYSRTWKKVLLLACLSSCINGANCHSGRSSRLTSIRHGKEYWNQYLKMFAPTNDAAAARDGVMLPPDSCLMTWEQFENMVVGRDWLSIYSIDDDFDINPTSGYKLKGLWTLNGTNIRRQITGWGEPIKQCLAVDGLFSRDSPTRAKLKIIFSNAFDAEGRVDYFVSCAPKHYFILFICYVKPIYGRCSESEIFLMVPDQRPLHPDGDLQREGDIILNDLPWSKIESDFKRCLDQLFVDSTDPQLEWVWRYTECPHSNSKDGTTMV